MRTGLIVFGVVFLVLGGLLFYVPTQTAKSTTTVTTPQNTDTYTTQRSLNIPPSLTYAVLAIGAILLVLGFALPGPKVIVKDTAPAPAKSSSIVETSEHVETADGKKRKTVHERHETSE